MSDNSNRHEDNPIEVHCPICGFHEALNTDDERLTGLSREEKIERIRELQASADPFFTCDGCDSPKESAKILEIQ
jgi:hypothetical protein